MRPKVRGELSVGQSFALLAIGMVLFRGGIALGAALRMLAHGVSWSEAVRQLLSEPLGPSLAQLIALGVVLFLGVRLAHGDTSLRESLGIRPVGAQIVVLAMAAGACLQFPLVELTTVISDMVPAIAFDEEQLRDLQRLTRIDGPVRAITVPLSFVVIAPVTEELVFRGLLLPALRPRLGTGLALALTAVLFGVFHLHPLAIVYAAIAGIPLGMIALRTGSVVPAIAFHAAFNAVPIILPREIVAIPGFNVVESQHLPTPILIATTAAGVLALALLFRFAPSEED